MDDNLLYEPSIGHLIIDLIEKQWYEYPELTLYKIYIEVYSNINYNLSYILKKYKY